MYQVSRHLTGFEPHIISIADEGYADEEQRDGVAFHRIRIGRLYRRVFQKILGVDPYSYARRVARRLVTIRPDIVHVHNAPTLFAELARYYRGPARFILHMHNEMSIEKLPPDAVLFTVSRYLKDWYAAHLPGTDIRIITNGVDTETFCPLPTSKTVALRTRLRLPTGKKRSSSTLGGYRRKKARSTWCAPFAELRKRRQDVFLLLVGEVRTGADRRGDYGRGLLAACEALGNDCYHAGTVEPSAHT